MIIDREITPLLKKSIKANKVVVLYGPRRSGKTTLLRSIQKGYKNKQALLWLNGDDIRVQRALSSQNADTLHQFLGNNKLVIIDEAQRIANIGINLKIIVDSLWNIAVIASGSASFDLANKVNESLTGRKKVFYLYPLSLKEIMQTGEPWKIREQIDHWLVFGEYPEIVLATENKDKESLLMEIVSSYLYKDILEYEGIKQPKKILDLLRLLAFQIGGQVSVSELANNLSMDFRTVEKYLDLLEKSFVIYSLRGFSRNLRKEVYKMSKYYFYDNGIRNALIENFNALNLRNDAGQLWENFLIIERKKYFHYQNKRANRYFWRTYDQQEVDLVEEYGGKLQGYEFKWGIAKKNKIPKDWLATYANASYKVINKNNYLDFIS